MLAQQQRFLLITLACARSCWQNLGQLGAVGTLVELFTDKAS